MLKQYAAFAAGLFLLAALPLVSSAQVSFAAFPIPTPNSGPQGITTDPSDGSVWFAENSTDIIGRLTVNGAFTEYPVPAGSGVEQIVVGPDGNLYFTPANKSFIGQINPSTGVITQFAIPNLGSNVAAPTGIAVGSDGNIWFAEAGTQVNAIGHVSTSGQFFSPIPIPIANSIPQTLTLGPDGNIWFTEQCPTRAQCDGIGRIGTVRSGSTITEYTVGAGTEPFGIASDGTNLWFTERGTDAVAKISTSGTVSGPYALSSGAMPLGITRGPGPNAAMWFTEPGVDKIGSISTNGGTPTEYPVSQANTGPYYITVGPDGALWFPESDTGAIGRISSISFESFANVPGALTQVAIGADGSVYGINSGDQIYTYNFSNSSWTNIPGGLMFIAAGSSNSVWGLNAQNHIYHLNSDNTWTQIGGELNSIAVGADGDVWGLNVNNSIYHYVSSTQSFDEVGGTSATLSKIAVGSAGAVYGLNSFGSAYWYNPGSGFFQWLDTSVGFDQIAAGPDGDLWTVKGGVPYHWDVLHNTFDATSGVTGVTQIAVGSGASVFALAASGSIWQWDATSQSWVQLSGSLMNIGVGANGTVWGVNSAQQIFKLQGAPVRPYRTLSIIPGAALDQISVGVDGAVWGVKCTSSTGNTCTSEVVYHFNSGTQTFQAVPGAPNLSQVSVGAGNDVWGVACPIRGSTNCTVYEYLAGPSPTWQLIPGELNQIAVGANGGVWGVNASGQTYYYDFGSASWVEIPGNLLGLSVGADGAVWGINTGLQIYRYSGGTAGAVGTWDNIPGSLADISVGSANAVWGLNTNPTPQNNIYTYDNASASWTPISGNLIEVWASFDGAVWGVNSNHSLYQWNGTSFNLIGENVTGVVVGNATNVWAINATTGAVYMWF